MYNLINLGKGQQSIRLSRIQLKQLPNHSGNPGRESDEREYVLTSDKMDFCFHFCYSLGHAGKIISFL